MTEVEALAARLGLELPHLQRAREATRQGLDARRRTLASIPRSDGVAVIFVGSWGRCEVTASSDNDFWVLSVGDDEIRPTVDEVREALSSAEGDFKDPGNRGPFANPWRFRELAAVVGTDEDVNKTLTARMLLVLESVAVVNQGVHEQARRDLIDEYLEPPIKPHHPPRLFLNDVIRYWRTMCVDFAGKMRERNGQGWGLRNAKLRTTRKMLFASGLLPLLRCADLESEAIPPFLVDQFGRPPADRVADAFIHYEQLEAAQRVFAAYDRFLELLGDEDRRNTLDAIKDRAEADGSEAFQAAVAIGNDVQEGLLDLLFSPGLSGATRSFAIF